MSATVRDSVSTAVETVSIGAQILVQERNHLRFVGHCFTVEEGIFAGWCHSRRQQKSLLFMCELPGGEILKERVNCLLQGGQSWSNEHIKFK